MVYPTSRVSTFTPPKLVVYWLRWPILFGGDPALRNCPDTIFENSRILGLTRQGQLKMEVRILLLGLPVVGPCDGGFQLAMGLPQ